MSGGGFGFNRFSESLTRKIARDEGGGYVPIRATYYWLHTTSGGNSGTLTPPENFTITLNAWPDGVDALVVTIDANDLPTYQQATTALGVPITVTLDVAGAYVLSGTPSDATVAVIYMARGFLKYYDESVAVEQFIFDLPELYNYIGFSTTPAGVPTAPGTMSWNEDDHTLDLIINAVTLQLGQESMIRVKNETGVQIDNGTACMFAGVLGASGRIKAAPLVSDGSVLSSYFLGVATEDIAINTEGFVTSFGQVRGVDTDAWTVGDILYPDPLNPGGFVNAIPLAPSLKIPVAVVLSKSPNGRLFVRPELGSELHELHDVSAVAPANLDVLMRDTASGTWVSRQLAATVDDRVCLAIFEERPTRDIELNIHGTLRKLVTADTLSTGVPIPFSTGSSKLAVAVKAGTDFAGSMTVTGNTVNRDTGAVTIGDTEVLTVDALSVDSATTDSGGNLVHDLVDVYLTAKWFEDAVTISTTDLNLSDVDVYQVAFEQFGDVADVTLTMIDFTFDVTNALAAFNAHAYAVLHNTGNKFSIQSIADFEKINPVANTTYRRKRSGAALGIAIDGTKEGIFMDVYFNGNAAYFENFNSQVCATTVRPVNIT